MILPLLKMPPLLSKNKLPSLIYGIFWNRYFHVGRTRIDSRGTHISTRSHQLGLDRIRNRFREIRKVRKGRTKLSQALSLTLLFFFVIFVIPLKAQVTQSVTKNSRPLWEGGLGVVAARVPAYPGADQYNLFTLPVPAFFYRGTYVRADEEGGMRGRFFKNNTFEINLSIGGSLPASSKDNDAREGMPDLLSMAELGPGLLATLWEYRGESKFKLGINIPLRTALSLDFWSIRERGLVFNPLIYFITEDFIGNNIFTYTSLQSRFASQKFHRVFYNVDSRYATENRPSYSAESGYMSTSISQGFSTQITSDVVTFLGLSYSHYKGSANYNSPLMKQDYNFNMAFGLIWWFYESDQRESTEKIQITQNQFLNKGPRP